MTDIERLAAEWAEAFNAHDESRLRGFMADHMVFRAPGSVSLEGPDEVVEYTMGWLNAFPDARITVERVVVSGDWVAQQYVFRGTHTATLRTPTGGIPATGRRIEGQVADFSRIEDGRLVETTLYFDQVDVLTQLGLMPELARA